MKMFEFFNIEVLADDGDDPVFYQRESRQVHSPYEMEQLFFGCIKGGDVDSVERLSAALVKNDPPIRVGRMSNSELRQAQYLSVAFITLGTRYAIEGGLRESDAYNMSDRFVRRIDAEKDPNAIILMCLDTMKELAQAVCQAAPRQQYSLPIRKCIDYIHANLHDKISLDTLAELCSLSPVYLSSLFKKETGINLSQYILSRKLEQSKTMIRAGQYGFEEISNYLGFCSQSYYIRCFKREYNMTPREYKQSGKD